MKNTNKEMTDFEKEIIHKIDTKTKPPGALGKLEDLAFRIAKIQNTLSPVLKKPAMLVFAADHGISDEGVSPFPKEVTWQMVMNFVSGGAAINVFCKQNNFDLNVVDAGVDYDFPKTEGLIHAKIDYGTQNMKLTEAMSIEQCKEALKKGAEIVDKKASEGCNIIGFGEMGISNTSSASVLMSKFCKIPIEETVGKGTGLDDKGILHKKSILKEVMELHKDKTKPLEILASVGGFEIAMITGAMLKAYQNNMIILIDGFISTAALLAAHAMENNILDHCIFTHKSDENGHAKMLEFLHADPILHLNMRLGEGSGAAVAYPIIESAVNFLNNMASFESAGVSEK
ncbi:MAG: nicotinate-nucleotide--dimethylbenzimidazole phosphoribosyltransferase [Flavobacteriia bacterium]|nr:MAG: nicotinate-nucleotide--dimethylbenzimidazole phosphoribosyltransferase [Flavobacteriia bacterium]